MRTFLLSGLACAGLLLAMPDAAFAHGGQYRGPSDIVPPNPGGGGGGRSPGASGPSTPGPGGPSTPGPSGPSTPGPAGPGTGGPSGPGGAGAPTTGGMDVGGDDFTRWQFWWEFNKDPYINLKSAVHTQGTATASDDFHMGAGKVREATDTLKPTDAQILLLLPKLKQALDSTEQRDITSSCMIAMAKIGKSPQDFDILDVFRARLANKDQEIRETAALALGISQMTEAVDDLIALATDNQRGRALVDDSEVDDRTRSFATYGLGLVAYATTDVDLKRKVLDGALEGILADQAISDRNIRVAAINAVALLRPTDDEKGRQLLQDACTVLEGYWTRKMGPGEQLIQAHVPPAVAKLLVACPDEDIAKHFKGAFFDELVGKGDVKRTNDNLHQSCILALGQMAEPHAKGSKDAAISEALADYFRKGKDKQAAYFALIALAQIGGDKNRDELLKALEQGGKALEKPWAALALGVYSYRALAQKRAVDPAVGRALRSWLGKLQNPETRAAIAIALGLAKCTDAADDLRAMLEEEKHQDELAGYLCIGLALMEDQRSTEVIRNLVDTSVRRPSRLQQAAIALGKLGDKSAAELLAKMLVDDKEPNLAKMSAIASALGYIGDWRSIDPLTRMLFDESLTDLSRAFAVVALGGIADKELLPWNSKIGVDMNYRAAVETLTNSQSGILDIL